MSVGTITPGFVRGLRGQQRARWRDASPRTRTIIQTVVLLAVVGFAYHYSLATLLQGLTLDSPLAYIGLVPAIALGLASARSRPSAQEPAIHDRQVDYIVGLPLLAAALAINLFMPRRLSSMFWVWRIDLLSLPLFVAGVVAIVFGVRALWRQRLAVGFLFFAWPLPYTLLLLRLLNGFTNLTLAAVRGLLGIFPIASVVAGSGGSIFQVVHAGRAFPLSVVSACSGVNGMVGFLLVGSAFAAVVTGPTVRKTLWLMLGLGLLWAINLGRLLLIFWAGRTWGESFAIDTLHPFVGLVTFNLGIVGMLLAMRPVGLRFSVPGTKSGAPDTRPEATGSSTRARAKPLAVPHVFVAVTVVAVLGGALGYTNGHLRAYDLVASATGEPKLASYSLDPGSPPGWQATFTDSIGWAKPYFGEDSTWDRYTYTPLASGGGDLYTNTPITADVVNTSQLSSFSAYGVEACYRFHGYHLRDVAQVSMGGGITGQALSYSTGNSDWTALYWIWPVRSDVTGHTRYERVILYMLNTIGSAIEGPSSVIGVKGLQGALNPNNRVERQLLTIRAFLVSFGREVIQAQSHVLPGSRLVARHQPTPRRPPQSQPDLAKPPA